MNETVQITVELSSEQAWELAQFFKRLTFSDYRANSTTDDEAVAMQDAGERLRQALADAGFAPR